MCLAEEMDDGQPFLTLRSALRTPHLTHTPTPRTAHYTEGIYLMEKVVDLAAVRGSWCMHFIGGPDVDAAALLSVLTTLRVYKEQTL